MSLFETLKLVHVLFAITWIGGATFVIITMARSRRGPLAHKLAMARNTAIAGNIFMVSGIVILAVGVWMVLDRPDFEFSQAWIIIGIVGLVISALIGARFFGPQSEALVAEYEAGDEAAGDTRVARMLNVAYVDTLLLVIIVWAMVVKPGL